MTDVAIAIRDLGKMYRLYRHPADKVLDAFGVNKFLFWRKNYYQEFWALRGLNLEIKRGERLGLIGRNGAGKSTLLKIITGNIAPTEGKVEVKGRVQALMELGTGFHPEFTGRQNIQASLAYQGLSQAKIRELEEEIIDFSELDDFIDQPIKTYSAGMYARLAFSTATSVQPEILIIDEILGAGDAYFAGKCVGRMKKLTEESGATVLFVSHDLGSVQALCDRIIWIKRGRVIDDGNPLRICKAYYQEVQNEENIRLQAQNQGISKKQLLQIKEFNNAYQPLLFRLVTNNHPPSSRHKIRVLQLKAGNEVIAKIELGEPMDNDQSYPNHLLCVLGQVDWSEPQTDNLGHFRYYMDCKSLNKQAPFVLTIPKFFEEVKEISLEVKADISHADKVFLDIYDEQLQSYQRIGEILPDQEWNKFDFPLANLFSNNNVQAEVPELEPQPYKFLLQSNTNHSIYIASIELENNKGQNILIMYPNKLDTKESGYELFNQEKCKLKIHEEGEKVCWEIQPTNQDGIIEFGLKAKQEINNFILDNQLTIELLQQPNQNIKVFFDYLGNIVPTGEIISYDTNTWHKFRISLDIISNLDYLDTKESTNWQKKSILGHKNPDTRIEKVRFLDKENNSVVGIEEGEKLTVEINYYSGIAVKNPVFAMTIYTLDGLNIAHANSVIGNLQIDEICGSGKVCFVFDPFYGGPGEYVLSASIFENLDPTQAVQPKFYDQHDRAYRFRIWKQLGIALNLGLLKLPYTVKHYSNINITKY